MFRERRQGKGRRHYKKREQRGISGELRGIQSNIQRNRGNSIFNRSGKIFTILCPRVRNKADAVRKREAREEAKEGVEIGNFRINILLVILGEETRRMTKGSGRKSASYTARKKKVRQKFGKLKGG